ncbi:cell wall hydrolase [Thalassospira sp. SM2505]
MMKDALLLVSAGGLAFAAYQVAKGKPVTSIDFTNAGQISQEVDVIARTIWGEARGEGERGMQAVANVIMNRAKKGGWWGNSPVEVCLKPAQFSAWNRNDPNFDLARKVTTQDPQFRIALTIAGKAVAGTLPDITGGATHYFNPNVVLPSWASALTSLGDIGNHRFYV